MEDSTPSLPEQNDSAAQEISRKSEAAILTAVRQAYGNDMVEPRVLYEETFFGRGREGLVCFKVLDTARNRLYGVTAELQPDQTLKNFRVGNIPE